MFAEEIGGTSNITGNGHSVDLKPTGELSGRNNRLAFHVDDIGFNFTETDRYPQLVLNILGQGGTYAENDGATHVAKLQERNVSPLCTKFSKDKVPSCHQCK